MLLSASGRIFTAKIQEAVASGDTIGYAMHYSRSHDAVIGVYDAAGNVIDRHAQSAGEFKGGAIDTPLLGREKYKPHVGRGLIN